MNQELIVLVIEQHMHMFKGVSVYVDGHLHLFSGVSSAALNLPGHTHTISGNTTTDAAHYHPYSVTTYGPTYVDAAHYKHYHYYEGRTDLVLNHRHPMSGTTFVLGE